jgi:hypothetical protein
LKLLEISLKLNTGSVIKPNITHEGCPQEKIRQRCAETWSTPKPLEIVVLSIAVALAV